MSTDLLEEYIETGNGAAIEDLLNSNPRLAAQRSSHGISPLLLACYYNKPQLARLFIKYLDRLSIFELAAMGLRDEVIAMVEAEEQLVNDVSDHGFSALGIATHFGHEDIVRYLLTRHADPNVPSMNGYHVFPLHTAVGSGFNGVAKLLIEAGAEVNVLQSSGITPLHLAAQHGNIEMIILLLENGASVEIENESGQTAADLARERGHMEIAQILTV